MNVQPREIADQAPGFQAAQETMIREITMNRRHMLRFAAASALALAAASSALAQAPRKVTISHSSPVTSHFGVAALAFKSFVETNSQGRFQVTVQRLDNERESVESVQLGSQEFTLSSTGPVGNFVAETRVFDVPFLFRDYSHARGVLDSSIGKAVLARFEARGLVGMGFGENGFRHLTTSTREIKIPADVKGLKIRTMENPVHMQAWSSAGVLPTPMAFSELPPALQQGVVDGQENPIPVILSNNFNQLQKYLFLTGHVYSPGIFLGNPAFLKSLNAADRKIFDDAVVEAIKVNRGKVEADERDGVAELRRRGMDVREMPNREAFREAMATATAAFERQFGAEQLKQIRDWKAGS
jgi:TRAP-type transport system periplasmic protein